MDWGMDKFGGYPKINLFLVIPKVIYVRLPTVYYYYYRLLLFTKGYYVRKIYNKNNFHLRFNTISYLYVNRKRTYTNTDGYPILTYSENNTDINLLNHPFGLKESQNGYFDKKNQHLGVFPITNFICCTI